MSLEAKPYLQKFNNDNYEVLRDGKLELLSKDDYLEIEREKVGDLLANTEVIFQAVQPNDLGCPEMTAILDGTLVKERNKPPTI